MLRHFLGICRIFLGSQTYAFRVLPSSEVLLADGNLVASTILGEGSVTVLDDVVQGWDEGVPPLRFEDGVIRVLGDWPPDPPPPPVDAGFKIAVGDARGRAGDIVAVPVFASSREPLFGFRVALAFDPASLAVDALDVAVTNLRDGQPARVLAQDLGLVTVFRDCVEEPEQRCWFGVP